MPPERQNALALLEKYNKTPSLRSHALCVEAAMRHFARLYGEDGNYWGIVGLLHDLDYEMFPAEHCKKSAELLRENGYDEAFIHAVTSHGWGICSDAEPELPMEKALYAVDELCGLITAAVYMRPSKSVLDLELPSLKKKFKDKGFAAGVNRELIRNGAARMGMELDELMQQAILGLRAEAKEIGLAGEMG